MDRELLESILMQLPGKKVLVVGDYFLDQYLEIDPRLNQPSIETGLTAYQVVARRLSPGAAGNVAHNLAALGLGEVIAVGAVGDDGEGAELLRALRRIGVRTDQLLVTAERVTPTYTKPVVMGPSGESELNRLDIQNRTPTPETVEARIIEAVERLSSSVDAIAVVDQVEADNHGAITGCVREALARIGRDNPGLPILCDSRARIGRFRHVMIKPNRSEAVSAALQHGMVSAVTVDSQLANPNLIVEEAARFLHRVTGRAGFLTDGPNGQYVMSSTGGIHSGGFPVEGPVDPVGAGDSTAAGILSALCCGASPPDAAAFGSLAASVTVRKLGTTGAASPDELRARWREAGLPGNSREATL